MSYNGSGTFQINTTGQPVVTGTVISSTAFNALTADLATGLSTAITKDGQTATTARIPFAQGITSTLVTDSSSTSTGSIITAGGVGIAKNLYVGVNANIAGTLSVTGSTTLTNPVINNIKMGYSTTATAAGTTTLTVSSNYRQFFTGSTTQTIVLPVTSTLVTGMAFEIENNSTGLLTVNSSGGNLVGTIPAGVCAHAVCIGTTLTTAADWDWDYISTTTITGTGANVLGTSPTITSATLVTPALGTPSSGSLVNCTDLNYTGFKNRIINGAMVIDQRNAGASVTATNAGLYTVDRWQSYNSIVTSKFTVQQTPSATETGYATRVAAGFTSYLACTSSSAYSIGSGDYFVIYQKIEGFNFSDMAWGTANAKTITLSFLAYSSLTGTFGGSIQNSAQNRNYIFSYSIPVANTWTQINITITGDTTGTWVGATNGIGAQIFFSLGAGSGTIGSSGSWGGAGLFGVTGQTNIVATSGATFYITGVQLEKGSTATSFDYRPYGTELALCQRYAKVIISSSSTGGTCVNTTSAQQRFIPPVTMRSAPTATISTAGSWTITDDFAADYTASTLVINSYNASVDLVRASLGGFSALTAGRFVAGSPGGGTAQIILSAEL